jgi:hypothetical protein
MLEKKYGMIYKMTRMFMSGKNYVAIAIRITLNTTIERNSGKNKKLLLVLCRYFRGGGGMYHSYATAIWLTDCKIEFTLHK